jgi:hypothetical protein
MALETASFIDGLNSTNPVATDGLAQADDHIRLIKSSVKATFPSITGAVNADHVEISTLSGYTGTTADHNLTSGLAAAGVTSTHVGHLNGVSSNIQTQLNNLSTSITNTNNNLASAVPTGMVMMWSGAANAIPSGYVLCDGNNSTPDLRDRFVVGAGSGYAVGNTGGSSSVTLTAAQMPSHTHTYSDLYVLQQALSPGIDIDFNATTWDPNGNRTGTTNSAGSGQSHENRPPYYALCYVMKT